MTDDPATSHNATLKVEYREERGRQIAVNLFGTDITCKVLLNDQQNEQTVSLVIRESPSYTDLVNAPYIEVVEKLQANPYFYFLGDIIRERMQTHIDTIGALIRALDQQFNRELHPQPVTPLDTLVSPGETFPDLDIVYSAAAPQNTIDELGRLKDSRAVHLLERLTSHANRITRLHAVVALGQFDDPSLVSVITGVAEKDRDAAGTASSSPVCLARNSMVSQEQLIQYGTGQTTKWDFAPDDGAGHPRYLFPPSRSVAGSCGPL